MLEQKERPILFSTPMVQSILEGRKTQTRRVIKFPDNPFPNNWVSGRLIDDVVGFYNTQNDRDAEIKCPYGKPGDLLYVRETWGLQVRNYGGGTGEFIVFKADNPDASYCVTDSGRQIPVKWKPSIHMPKKSARIWLNVTDVRVERVQEINEDDAVAEGIDNLNQPTGGDDYQDYWKDYRDIDHDGWPWIEGEPIESFKTLWNSINKKRGFGWDKNPWVWVVEFEVVSTTGVSGITKTE